MFVRAMALRRLALVARGAPAMIAASGEARAQAIGACCVGTNCSITTQALCTGTYRGDFTDCLGGLPTSYVRTQSRPIPDASCPTDVVDTVNVTESYVVSGVSV